MTKYPFNVNGNLISDQIDSRIKLSHIGVGYGRNLSNLTIADDYELKETYLPNGKFQYSEIYLSMEGTKNEPGLVYFEYYLDDYFKESDELILNIISTIPSFEAEEIDYDYTFIFISNNKQINGNLTTLRSTILDELYFSKTNTQNGFSYNVKGNSTNDIKLIDNTITIKKFNPINNYLNISENWIIEDFNETHYAILINVTSDSNFKWPFSHRTSPAVDWIFNPLLKPENFKENPANSGRFLKKYNYTKGYWVFSNIDFSSNPSLDYLNNEEVPLDIFMIPDTYLNHSGELDIDINKTILLEFIIPKNKVKRFSSGIDVKYDWINCNYNKKILLKSNDHLIHPQSDLIEYKDEGYLSHKERKLIGSSEQLYIEYIEITSIDAEANSPKETKSTSIDVFEIIIPETKVVSYSENISILNLNTNEHIVYASINNEEIRSIHSDKEMVTVESYLYSLSDLTHIDITMTKPYFIDDFGLPLSYEDFLNNQNFTLELNRLYTYEEASKEWYSYFCIDRKNANYIDFNINYFANLSSSLSKKNSLEFWKPCIWELEYKKIFPPGEFQEHIATTTFNLPQDYQIIDTKESGTVSGNKVVFDSQLNENFTAMKVMKVNFVSKVEKLNKSYFFNKLILLILYSSFVIFLIEMSFKYKINFGILNKIFPYTITILFIEFFKSKPDSLPLTWVFIYLLILAIILLLIVKRYSKGINRD